MPQFQVEKQSCNKNLFSLIWIDISWPANIKRMDITKDILKNKISSSHHIEIPSDIKNDLGGFGSLENTVFVNSSILHSPPSLIGLYV